MSSLYEVSSLFLLIMNKPNIFGQVLGILTKGNKIDVISISGSWAYFKYNNNNAYVKKNSLKIINNTPVEEIGSVTIKFLNSDTNDEVYASQTINDLSFGTYTYNAKEIYGYKLNSTTPQYITLTSQNPNQTVIFYYTKISCSITIHYINENTNEYISDSKTITDLSLGSYSYGSIEINGYSLDDDQTKTVTLTESNPNATISFKYKQILGSVVIKYLSNLNSDKLLPSETINNLKLGEYTYTAKFISGYATLNSSTQTVTLTSSNPNVEITFKYTKLYGSVTIKYIDENSEKSVANNDQYSNLEFGSYSYNSKSISGYKLINSNTQTVIIDDTNLNQVVTFKYSKILGNITIKYLDKDSLSELSGDNVLTNIELGSYTFDAIHISNYSVYGDVSKTIILTDDNPNAKIEFLYSEILGSITIKYIDNSTNLELASEDVYNNLKLGDYTYSSKTISSYAVVGNSSKTISLTEDNTSVTITFEYKKVEIEIPNDINWNEVPYISTYYIKPVVKPGEEVLIDYYITDYYYKEYMEKYNLKEDTWGDDNWTEEVWNNEIFTVTVRIEGQEDKIFPNLKAGDHQVSLGSFSTEGEQKFSILCTDKYGRNSHELFNFFLVQNDVEVKEYAMTEDDLITYNIKNTDDYEVKKIIDLSALETKNITTIKAALVEAASNIIPQPKTYVCVIADTDGDGKPNNWWGETQVVYADDYDKEAVLEEATNTRKGIQQLLDDKKYAGYNKLTLLPGTYRVDHKLQIYIPTQFTLDMNGATFKLNQFTGNSSLMIELNNTFDSHVINGIIKGDYFGHDYANSANNSEWVNGISIGGEAKYSSFENLTIEDITGYGSGNGIANSRDGSLGYTYIYPRSIGNNFKLGDIDRTTGLDLESTTRTTSDFRDISGYEDVGYLSVSIYLGYQGNPCGTWNLICHFYDENKKFIKSIDSYQYRRIGIPKNSKYMRITILNESYPTNLSIQYFRIPTHCSFKNINLSNCRCVGMASAAMKDLLFEACEFTNCGQSSAKCAFDAEDGWDMMQDITFKSMKFNTNPNNHFLTCAGHNFIVDGQQYGIIYMWERTKSSIIRNCTNVKLSIQSGGLENIIRHGIYRIYNNEFIGGSGSENLIKNCTSNDLISGTIINSTLTGICDSSFYRNCNISIKKTFYNYLSKISLIDCIIKGDNDLAERYKLSFNGGHLDSYIFNNCKFYGKSILANHVNFYSGKFIGCYFEDTSIAPNVLANSNDIISFNNCIINYSDNNLIFYSPFAYTKGSFTNLYFTKCTINKINSNISSMIYAYAKPNGNCNFIDCIINIPENSTLFDGYPSYISNIENFIIQLTNSQLPSNIKLIGDNFISNTNLKFNIN